jgi:hypothetical protein
MDFVECFPKVNGRSVILTVANCFSKAAHFIALGHPYTMTMVARVFFTDIVHLHDVLTSIISDHDPTTFGMNCSSWQASSSTCPRPSTLNRMVSQSPRTMSSPCTSAASPGTSRATCCNGFHGPTSTTIQHTMRPSAPRHSTSSSGLIHQSSGHTSQALRGFRPSLSN